MRLDLSQSDIIWLDGGQSHVGTDTPEIGADGEAPRRQVTIKPFGLSKYSVTNRQFSDFVADTEYRTDAEMFGWSYVFNDRRDQSEGYAEGAPWWKAVEGGCWSAPFGSESDIRDLEDHPVVHISGNDARQYAEWCGGRLPTEAEWEYSARASNDDMRYPWGNLEPDDENKFFCNIWQGSFPETNTGKDGYLGTAPVDSFQPNGFGFHNMSGNVWEWTADRFRIRSIKRDAKKRNLSAAKEKEYVLKGGSFLCHKSYCWRYRIAARTGRPLDTSAGHTGFRVAFNP